MNKICKIFIVTTLISLFFIACSTHSNTSFIDTPLSGTINISVDESFEPVIAQAIKVYEASFPGTKIIAHYKTESECFKDFYADTSNRMIIVTRKLNDKESKFYKDSLTYNPATNMLAWDAITVITNKDDADTTYSLTDLQNLLQGKGAKNKKIIFDGLSATSTVHFAIDSILHGAKFDTNVVQVVKNSKEVINYIANNKNAIGFVGISWIGNPEATAQVAMLKKVKMSFIKCDACADLPYVKPTQMGIITHRYPLVRGLYYILKENYSGLGSGFGDFLYYERGQLIFRRAYLAPRMDFTQREVNL